MSDGNWSVRVAVIGAVGALAFVAYGAGLYAGTLPEPEHQGDATERAASNASESPSPPPPASGVAPLPAGDVEPSPKDQSYYNREDLQAQRVMAWWTRIMGIAAGVGIFLGGVSIWLIWRTWDATSDAAESSRKTLRSFIAKERAHLRIKRAEFSYEERLGISSNGFRLKLDNRGESACQVIEIGWQYSESRHWLPKLEQLIWKPVLVPSDSEEDSPHLGIAEFPSDPCWFMGRVKYKTLEDETFASYFSFAIQFLEGAGYGPDNWFAIEDRMIAMPWDT